MEKLIIEQLKQGNEDAFKYIYKQHYVLLCRFANQMLADAALAEEIVDDAIFYLWEHRSDIEIEYSIPHGVSEGKTAANGCKNRRYNTLIFS